MGEWIKLVASDGFQLSAWRATPQGTPKGGVVVIQEIFGVNNQIRGVTDRFANAGYLAIAPAIFDRVEPGIYVGFSPAERARGMGVAGKMDRDKALADIAAAISAASAGGKVGIVGFCLGGSYAWAAAERLGGLSAAVGYYGGNIVANKDLSPKVPTLLHFGEKDEHIPVSGVREVAALHPEVEIQLYPAGHAFANEERDSYHAPSAALAWDRTLAFLARHVG
jgi:carboxymethylenebutenolidase